jgi:hypothetical protein
MSLDLQSRIHIVLLMAKLESPVAVRRHLQPENMFDVPSENTIRNLYTKFLETGSVHDRTRSGRPSSTTTENTEQIEEVLATTSVNSIRGISQEVGMSKSVVHRTMRQVLGSNSMMKIKLYVSKWLEFPYLFSTIKAMMV